MPGFPTTEPTESEQLLVFLAQQRRVLSHAAYGLTDEQARLTPSVSVLSVGGIVKHVSQVEKFWTDVVLGRQAPFGTERRLPGRLPARPGRNPGWHLRALRRHRPGNRTDRPFTTHRPPCPGTSRCPLVPGRHRVLGTSLDPAPPDRRDSAPRRSRRHRARIDRRGYLVRSHGGRRELATLALGQALATSRLGGRRRGHVAGGIERPRPRRRSETANVPLTGPHH